MKRVVIVGSLALVMLSGCDALEARRLEAEAAASRAKAEQARAEAAELSAIYTGKVAVIEAKQEAAEEDRESRLLAETQRALLRQLDLERKAARRANDLYLLAIIGAPFVLVGAVAGGLVLLTQRKRRAARRVMVYRQVTRLQRQGLLRPGFDKSDVDAILSGAVPLEWYTLPAESQRPQLQN